MRGTFRNRVTVLLALACVLVTPVAARAGTPGTWTKLAITKSGNALLQQVGLLRTPDGRLQAAWVNDGTAPLTFTMQTRSIAANGTAGATTDILANQPGGAVTPGLSYTASTNALTTWFGAQDSSGSPFNGWLYSATSTGGAWSLNGPASTGSPGQAYAASVVNVASDNAGHVVQAWAQAGTSVVHTGSAPGVSYAYEGFSDTYDTNVACDASGAQFFVGWASLNSATGGVRVAQIDPATGAKSAGPWTLPLSTTNTVYGARSFSPMSQRVPMVGRASGGVYVAYPTGYPSVNVVRLWKLGNTGPGAPRTVASTAGGNKGNVALAAETTSPNRLWIVWTQNDSHGNPVIKGRRSNAAGTSFGAIVSRAMPAGGHTIWKLAADGGAHRCDIVALVQSAGGYAQYHAQLLPGLSLSRSPASIKIKKRVKLTFRVTDAGSPVAGASVKVAGKTAHTNSSGYAKVTVGKYSSARKLTASASKSGYVGAKQTVRVTR